MYTAKVRLYGDAVAFDVYDMEEGTEENAVDTICDRFGCEFDDVAEVWDIKKQR